MPRYHDESWYLCLNCNQEYQINDIFFNKKGAQECPECGSHEFILSSYEEEDTYPVYDYSNYDKYDEYY